MYRSNILAATVACTSAITMRAEAEKDWHSYLTKPFEDTWKWADGAGKSTIKWLEGDFSNFWKKDVGGFFKG